MSPTFRWFRVVVYFVVMDPVRLKRRHTRVWESERWGRCVQIGAVELFGSFSFLLFVPFTFFLVVYIVSDGGYSFDIYIYSSSSSFPFDHFLLFLFFWLVVCLGYTRGKKPIDTRWSEPAAAAASVERNKKWEGSLFSICSLTLFCQPFFHPAVKEERGAR